MGVILAATDALNWYANLVGADAAKLTGELGALQAPGKCLFLPYLGGERTPAQLCLGPGCFLPDWNMPPTGKLQHARCWRGVTFAIRDCRDALAATGTRLEHLLAVGGGSRSEYWLRLIATALDCPVQLPISGDFGGAFGAARLAIMATTGAGAEIATLPKIERVIEPDPSLLDAFDAGHSRFRAAQSAIKDLT